MKKNQKTIDDQLKTHSDICCNENSQVLYIEDLAIVLSNHIQNSFLNNISDQLSRNIVLTHLQHKFLLNIIWQNAKILQLAPNTQIVAKNRRVKITDLTYCAYIAHNFLTFNQAKSDILDCLKSRFPESLVKKRYKDYYMSNILANKIYILDIFISYGYILKQQNTFDNIFEMEN